MRALFIIILIATSSIFSMAQSQLAMSFTGSFNIANEDLKTNFDNGFGGNVELYYFFKDSPLSLSLSLSINQFVAKDEYLSTYKESQNNTLDFSYSIDYYTIPILASVNYRFFREKKFQPSLGISAGYYSLTHKIKQKGNLTSDTNISPYHKFGVYPHASLIYAFSDNMGILLKAGYNVTLGGENNVSYTDLRLGLIYKI